MIDVVRPVNPSDYGSNAVDQHEDDRYLRKFARAVVASKTGEQFFDALVRLLWAEVGADLVFIGEINEAGDGVDTKMTFQHGSRGPDFSYALAGTPCATVIGPLQACIYADGVAEKFPDDHELSQMGARGYAGVPLFDTNGQRIGVLVAVTMEPITNPDSILVALKLFAQRAGLELEHERAVRTATHELAEIEQQMAEADHDLLGVFRKLGNEPS